MMSSRDSNLSAAIYVAVGTGLTAICLVIVLVSPGNFPVGRSAAWMVLIALFFGMPILNRLAHRSRIKEAVRNAGGTAISIRREPFWRQPEAWWHRRLGMARRIKYRVVYSDLLGVQRDAFCLSGWFHGVEWLNAIPTPSVGG